MASPRIQIDLEKIAHNAKILKELYGAKGIEVIGVTKSVCGDPAIAEIFVNSGISTLADSRIENIKRMRSAGIQAEFFLLRTPSLSQVDEVVKYADLSLNTELSVIKRLSECAIENHSIHKIILMVELGDLREGIMPSDLDATVKEVLGLKGIKLVGIGSNLACYGAIKPDEEKMQQLSALAIDIEDRFGLTLSYVSGGNSANYSWFSSTNDTGRVNNLRLGESILLGCETLQRKAIPGLFTDAFTLIAEVIESKMKPSEPYGEVCMDAFGNVPSFQDFGLIKRAILNIGIQDVQVSGLNPRLDNEILGASSDHMIITTKKTELKIGDEVEFDLNYGALLSAMISPYVFKKHSDVMNAQEYCELVEKKYRRHLQLLPSIVMKEDNTPLVSLKKSEFNLVFEPSIIKDYQYMVREAVYEKIGRISRILDQQDKKLIIRSAWRSFEHQRLLWEEKVKYMQGEFPDKGLEEIEENVSYFITPPSKSMHATGGAVDALIFDLKTDLVMNFGTNDGLKIELNDKCYPLHPHIPVEAKENRKLLIGLFEKEDFAVDLKEYWHFDYGNVSWAIEKEEESSMYDIIAS